MKTADSCVRERNPGMFGGEGEINQYFYKVIDKL